MRREEYVPWAPLPGLPSVLYVEALHDDAEGLRILLRGEDKASRALRVTFDRVVGYRNVNESFRLRTWASIAGAPTRTCLLMVRGSAWVEWLVAESAGLLDGRALTHYAVHTGDDCIDVVVESPPRIEWL